MKRHYQVWPAGGDSSDKTKNMNEWFYWLLGRQVLRESDPSKEPGCRSRTKLTKDADTQMRHSQTLILIASVRSWQEEVQSEEEMARRRALLLEKQQKRTEELKKRRQWHEQERENR